MLLGPPGVRYDAPIRRDNTFLFEDIPDASYLLTIHSRDHFFPPLRVDVTRNEGESSQNISAWATFRGNEWDNRGQSFGTGKDVLKIDVKAGAEKQFYQERGGFNILSFLKSPMILMALASLVLVVGMPYIMENSKFAKDRTLANSMLIHGSGSGSKGRVRGDERQKPAIWQLWRSSANAEFRSGRLPGWHIQVVRRFVFCEEEVAGRLRSVFIECSQNINMLS